MSINIRLNKDINPNYIIYKINELIQKHRQSNALEDSILSIDIKTVSHISDEMILKLEHTLEKLDDNREHDLPEST